MNQWLARNRMVVFASLNVLLDLALLIMAPMTGAAFGLVMYTAVLFGLCTVPLALMQTLNGRYALLQIFMLTYFLHFGGLDVQHILLGFDAGRGADESRTAFLLPAEIMALGCGAVILLGYLGIARTYRPTNPAATPAEWSMGTILVVGLVFWVVGTAAEIYLGVFVVTENTKHAQTAGFTALGVGGTFVLMIGHYLQPLGALILAYGYARFRGMFWFMLILGILLGNLATGFVTDVKTTAMMAVGFVVVVRFLVDNRPPVVWTAAAVIGIALIFPIFQANRLLVSGERGLNHLQAFQNIGQVLQLAIASRDKVSQANLEARPPTFVERINVKAPLEMVLEHVGTDVPYLYGASLADIPLAFVPRLIIDKQSISVGQMFTHQIAHSDLDTYISFSHLGEFYWNFGWGGAFAGALLTGLILGAVGTWASLENGPSLTRVMILLVTVQSLCEGFEGEVSISYVVWMRALAGIGLLHLAFARRSVAGVSSAPISQPIGGVPVRAPVALDMAPDHAPVTSVLSAPSAAPLRFPNVMR